MLRAFKASAIIGIHVGECEGPMANERNPCIYYLSGDGNVRQLESNGKRFVPTDITASARAPDADLGSGLTAINTGSDRRVYYLSKNPNGHVQELAWVGKWAHTDVTGPTAAVLGSDLAVTGVGANFDPRGANGHVLESAWNGSSWTFFDVTASVHKPGMELAGSIVAAMGTGANYDPRVYYVGHDLHVWQLAWSSDEEWPLTT
jgi:hypothetical protein